MSLTRQLLGGEAEAAAEGLLRRKGYRILERNVRVGRGELDIVARAGETLVFVDVKARRTDRYGGVAYAVTARKQRQLIQLAARYLARRRLERQPCRFDVLLYDAGDSASPVLEHIENAFEVAGDDRRW